MPFQLWVKHLPYLTYIICMSLHQGLDQMTPQGPFRPQPGFVCDLSNSGSQQRVTTPLASLPEYKSPCPKMDGINHHLVVPMSLHYLDLHLCNTQHRFLTNRITGVLPFENRLKGLIFSACTAQGHKGMLQLAGQGSTPLFPLLPST